MGEQWDKDQGDGEGAQRRQRPPRIQPDLPDRLERALNHPLRAKLLAMLNDRPASASELAAELGEPLNVVAYHVRVLNRLECLEVASKEMVRGAEKTIYRGATRMLLTDDVWKQLSKHTRTGISVQAVAESFERAQAALEAGTLDNRDDSHVINMKMSVDEQGWEEISQAIADVYYRLETVEPEAVNRTPDMRDRFRVTVSLLCYESPPGK